MSPLKVGVLLPASRILPRLDQDFLAGLRAALAESRVEHELILEPTGNAAVPNAVTDKVQRLLMQHRPHAVTGILGSAMLRHVVPLFDGAGVPFIVNDVGVEPLLHGGAPSPNVFHNSFNLWQSTYALGYWAAQHVGKTAALAVGFHEAGYGIVSAFSEGFCDAGGGAIIATEVTHRVSSDEDPSDALRRLADRKPAFIMGLYSGQSGVSFARAYRALGLGGELPLLVSAMMVHEYWLTQMDGALDGARTAFSWDRTAHPEATDAFVRACRSVDWPSPDIFATLGYETGYGLSYAAEALNTRTVDRKHLIDAIARASTHSPRALTLDPETNEAITEDRLFEVCAVAGAASRVELVMELGLPDAFREARARFQGQEVRAGWTNPYLVA